MPIAGFHGHQTRAWADKLGLETETIHSLHREDNTVTAAPLEDAHFERQQVIDLCEQNLNFFAATAMPTVFEFDFPPILLAAWQLLCSNARQTVKRFPQIALGIPRAHAKTTLIKLYILYCVFFTKKRFILVICSTLPNAENILADVEDMLNEPNIIAIFGDWKIGLETNRNDLKKFGFRGRSIILGAIGQGGSLRGLNVKHARPDIMIFEDIQTKECSESQIQSSALERWMIGTAMKAKSPGGCVHIFVGNMYPGPNSILKKLKLNPQWVKFISGAILSDGTSLWPALHPLEDLVEELDNDISMGHPEIFFTEVLNDTEAGVNSRTDLSRIPAWPYTELDKPQGKFIIIDPSANKRGGDEAAIGRFEVYDNIPWLVEVKEENMSPGNTIRHALLWALEHKIKLVAVESTAYQYSLLYWSAQICEQLGITGITFVDVYSGSYSKNSRITDMLKALTSGETGLHTSVRQTVAHQIANWQPMRRENVDGILDLLTYAPKVLELYSSAIIADDTMEALEVEGVTVSAYNSPF